MTSARPMAPAISPPRSCSEPSVGEIDWTLGAVNFSGSEPYLRMLASWPAVVWVKPPVICALAARDPAAW